MAPRDVRPVYFLIVLLPVGVFVLQGWLVQTFGVPDLPVSADILQANVPHLEAQGRMRFLAALSIYMLVAVVAATVLIEALCRPLTRRSRVLAVAALAVLAVPVALKVWAHQSDPNSYRGYFQMGRSLVEAALAQGVVPGCTAPTDRFILGPCGEAPALEILRHGLDFVNLVAGVAVGSMAVASILCLGAPQLAGLRAEDQPAEKLEALQANAAQLKKTLYVSSLVLSTGMFLALSWMHWPLEMIAKDHRKDYETALGGTELLFGVYFSLLLLSFYLPVSFLLDLRARRLAGAALGAGSGETKRRAWAVENGLTTDFQQMLKEGLAIAGPVLAALTGGVALF
ncbi:hypothetical protein [Sagittula sp. S175]|uniref:hypothetical protein n=1 Tax=Sagittula sp. S175 TaxID=3415129 RepID=UPI003C7B1BA2